MLSRILEDSWNGRMPVTIEKAGAPSKWLTLEAARLLARREALRAEPRTG